LALSVTPGLEGLPAELRRSKERAFLLSCGEGRDEREALGAMVPAATGPSADDDFEQVKKQPRKRPSLSLVSPGVL